MRPRLKVVFDTNVYIQAALNPLGGAAAWLKVTRQEYRSFDLYISEPIVVEIETKLTEPKFSFSPAAIDSFLETISIATTMVSPTEKLQVVVSDPDDDMLFECAVAADAQLIVTADKAVLQHNPYRGIGVCHPRDLGTIFPADLF